MDSLIPVLVGWAFDRVQMIISAPNYGALWNGFGAIDLTVKRKIKAPMAYRIFVPYLVIFIERLFRIKPESRVFIYQTIKLLLVILAVYAVSYTWGMDVALLTFILLLVTIEYDYWDWAIEVGAVALATSGNLGFALVGGMLHGMSRETAPILPVAYYLSTGDLTGTIYLGLVVGLTMLAVRLYVGKRELYCDRWMWKENMSLLKDLFKWKPIYYSRIFISVVITVMVFIYIFITSANDWIIPLAIVVAGWLMAKADEPRVFSVAMIYIAKLLLGVWS